MARRRRHLYTPAHAEALARTATDAELRQWIARDWVTNRDGTRQRQALTRAEMLDRAAAKRELARRAAANWTTPGGAKLPHLYGDLRGECGCDKCRAEWTVSHTVDGTEVRSKALAPDARLKASGRDLWVSTIHPCDMARYHYAHSRDGKHWAIYREAGFAYGTGPVPQPQHKVTLIGTPEKALEVLRDLDKGVAAHIDLS